MLLVQISLYWALSKSGCWKCAIYCDITIHWPRLWILTRRMHGTLLYCFSRCTCFWHFILLYLVWQSIFLYWLVGVQFLVGGLGMSFHVRNAGVMESLHETRDTLLGCPVDNAVGYISLRIVFINKLGTIIMLIKQREAQIYLWIIKIVQLKRELNGYFLLW